MSEDNKWNQQSNEISEIFEMTDRKTSDRRTARQ